MKTCLLILASFLLLLLSGCAGPQPVHYTAQISQTASAPPLASEGQ